MMIHDRIQQKLDEKNLKQADIARATGKSTAAVAKWLSGQNVPKTDSLVKIAQLFGVTPNWLATGQGEMTAKAKQQFDNATPTAVKKTAPLLNSVQAGSFTEIGDSHYDEYLPYFGDYGNDRVYWLKVTGDSMIPDFKEGEYVLINADRQARAGKLCGGVRTRQK